MWRSNIYFSSFSFFRKGNHCKISAEQRVRVQCLYFVLHSWQMFNNRESYMFDNQIHEADTLSFQT